MRAALLAWFTDTARPFPWRTPGARDPYRVLVAEALLQQTQAARAVDAYERFLARFPNVRALASAASEDVLALWQGLGYYQRALRLHACAQAIVARHAAAVPCRTDALEALPGIGRYGARAIQAQAFGSDAIAVDANVRRVGARVLAAATPDDADIEAGLARLLPPEPTASTPSASLTEALIELGATVCTPRSPACQRCPLAPRCAGRDDPGAYPRPLPRPVRRREVVRPVVARRDGLVALARRPLRGRWAGLWGFPTAPDGLRGRPFAGFEHVLTHRTLDVRPQWLAAGRLEGELAWRPLAQVAEGGGDRPVAALDQRLAALVLARSRPGGEAPS